MLRRGENELAVRVLDPSLSDPEHVRMPHGKQGWANSMFPSRPSLYMTYGGIWQSVELRRHGPLVVDDVFINGDPGALVIAITVRNVATEEVDGRVALRTLRALHEREIRVAPEERAVLRFSVSADGAPWWSPEAPALHEALVDVVVEGEVSDRAARRFGLRTIRRSGKQLLLNDEPYRMKSVLVQGFRADGLYGEGDRGEIEREIRAAKEMGFNTLRLHIKAFDPRYLDACDELGMLVHSDIPVAEPIDHDEMGSDTTLTRRCVLAATEQVLRDRSHPSIVLWSAMNEICDDRPAARNTEGYERFARTLATTVARLDPTRPVIENDWVEPDPDHVFVSEILTAHWYGRLHAEYLQKIEAASERWSELDRPLLVTEFGDWGLPAMPSLTDPPFWDSRTAVAADLTATLWPDSVDRFVVETQRYQGLSDRLQMEVFRRHDSIAGYCLTELTDVPMELNGLLDLRRDPKPIAVREVTRGNQVVLPIISLDSLVVDAGGDLTAPVRIANDGPELSDVTVEAHFGDVAEAAEQDRLGGIDTRSLPPERVAARFDEEQWAARVGVLAAHRTTDAGRASLVGPEVPGSHDLIIRVRANGLPVAENRYPIHVVARERSRIEVRASPERTEALASVDAVVGSSGPLVVGEGALGRDTAEEIRQALDAGGTAVLLAQSPPAFGALSVPLRAEPVTTAWGSSVFHFTTDVGAIPCLPRRRVLVAEDSTIQAHAAIVSVAGEAFPSRPIVIAYKPDPRAMTGTIVGEHRVGDGRLIFCQYRLEKPAVTGDAAARAVLRGLLTWATDPHLPAERATTAHEDGRELALYSFSEP